MIQNGRVHLPWENRASTTHLARLERAVQSNDFVTLSALAALPLEITDEHGVPVAAYAAPRINAKLRKLESPHLLSPMGLRLINTDPALIAHAEAAARFQKEEIHPIAGQWLAWGEPLYLIGLKPDRSFHAMRAPPETSLTAGQPLGDPFPNLRITLPVTHPADRTLTRQILIAMFAVTIAVALLGGFLLWRDKQREKQLAGLRTQFIAGVSHELRTPLTALRIFIESMRMSPDLTAAKRDEYLETMQHETERLSRLVNNVLEFSRIERQRRPYALAPTRLTDLVESIAASTRPMMARAGYKLETTMDNPPETINADRDAIEQAVLNLLTNAMKYSGESRDIQLRVEAAGPQAAIEVRDFGIGIPAAEQQRIFDSFYRVPSNENRNIQGAGLGLTLVRHVMEGHGGKVTVDSQPGKGSTFRLLLPV